MFCKFCGAHNPDGSKFCRSCGATLQQAAAAPQSPSPASQNPAATAQYRPVNPTQPVAPAQPVPSFNSVLPTGFVGMRGVSNISIAAAVLLLLATLTGLLPWFSVSLSSIPEISSSVLAAFSAAGISTSFTLTPSFLSPLFGTLSDMANKLATYGPSMGNGYMSSSDLATLSQVKGALGNAALFLKVVNVAQIVSIALCSIAVYRVVSSRGSDLRAILPACIVVAVTAIIGLVMAGQLNSGLQSALTSSGAYGNGTAATTIVSAAWTLWASLICSVLAGVATELHRRGMIR